MTGVSDEVEALAYAAIEAEAGKRKTGLRAQLNQRLVEGDTRRVRSPLGDKLGSISKTDPAPKWQVTDPDALDEHLRGFPGNVQQVEIIADEPAAIEVLRVHAPELLRTVEVLAAGVVEAALAQSAATGEPAAPGISLVKPSGTVTVRPEKNALDAVALLVRAGQLDFLPPPALPAPEARSAS